MCVLDRRFTGSASQDPGRRQTDREREREPSAVFSHARGRQKRCTREERRQGTVEAKERKKERRSERKESDGRT